MKIAVTNHAVDRYQERVEGAKSFDKESVRSIIRLLVEDGFKDGAVRLHPTDTQRRIIPFMSGPTVLYLSIGPNTSAAIDADLAVIGVLFEKDLTQGKIGTGATLGDVAPELASVPTPLRPPKYVVLIGSGETIEEYRIKDDQTLKTLLETRNAEEGQVHIYELRDP